MNVLILGATRGVGRQLLAQALDAGHGVTAFARTADTLPPQPRLRVVSGSVDDGARLSEAMRGQDAVVSTLGKGMTFFADVMFRLTLTPEEIESERQIILEERRRGLSARQRTSDYVMEHFAPGSLYGQRDMIGTEATIKGVMQ